MSLFALAVSPEALADMAADQAAEVAAQTAASDFGAWAEDVSALYLAQDLAAELDTPIEVVWHRLCYVPAHMLPALTSPHGWGALAAVIACDLGSLATDYQPQVH